MMDEQVERTAELISSQKAFAANDQVAKLRKIG
jgi:hypothetical protein